MRIDVLTLFPGIFTSFLEGSLIGAARTCGLLDVRLHCIRDFAEGPHRQVDDRPFGGGPGMLLMPGPVVRCVEAVQAEAGPPSGHLVIFTPGGRPLTQAVVEELASKNRLVLLCGRYEGFDDRIREILRPDEISLGEFVLSGGEVAAMAVIDAVGRLVPGVLGDAESPKDDSFSGDERLVEGPQYTRPREFRGLAVPDVLLSGDHASIRRWRHEQAVEASHRRTVAHPDRPFSYHPQRAVRAADGQAERSTP